MNAICENCMKELEYGSKFCGHCGRRVEAGFWDAFPPQPVSDATMTQCDQCGAMVRFDNRFCTNCGEPLHGSRRGPIERRTVCEITLDAQELSQAERLSLGEYLRGYMDPDRPQIPETVTGELTFRYDCDRQPVIDKLLYRMAELLLADMGKRFPRLRASFSCKYAPDPENLKKGYDDHGGFMDICLENGTVRVEDGPIA